MAAHERQTLSVFGLAVALWSSTFFGSFRKGQIWFVGSGIVCLWEGDCLVVAFVNARVLEARQFVDECQRCRVETEAV